MIFGKQDTHVPRAGRDLIRKELDDANVIASVRARHDPRSVEYPDEQMEAVLGGASTTCIHSRRVIQGSLGCGPHTISLLVHAGGV